MLRLINVAKCFTVSFLSVSCTTSSFLAYRVVFFFLPSFHDLSFIHHGDTKESEKKSKTSFFLKKWLQRESFWREIRIIDPVVWRRRSTMRRRRRQRRKEATTLRLIHLLLLLLLVAMPWMITVCRRRRRLLLLFLHRERFTDGQTRRLCHTLIYLRTKVDLFFTPLCRTLICSRIDWSEEGSTFSLVFTLKGRQDVLVTTMQKERKNQTINDDDTDREREKNGTSATKKVSSQDLKGAQLYQDH